MKSVKLATSAILLAFTGLLVASPALATDVEWEKNRLGYYVTTTTVPPGAMVSMTIVQPGKCSVVFLEAASETPAPVLMSIAQHNWDPITQTYEVKRNGQLSIVNLGPLETDSTVVRKQGDVHRFYFSSGKVIDVNVTLTAE